MPELYQLEIDHKNFSMLLFAEHQDLAAYDALNALPTPLPADVLVPPLTVEESPFGYDVNERNTQPLGDFAALGFDLFCLNPKARALLDPLLRDQGLFLTLDWPGAEFHAYKILKTVPCDIFDSTRSDIRFWPDGRLKSFRTGHGRVVVKEDQLAELPPIFRLGDRRGPTLVTDAFTTIVECNQLTGLACECIWPPPDPQLERQKFLEKRRRKKR